MSSFLPLNTDNRVMVGAKFKFKPYNCMFFCLLSPNLRVHVTTADVYRKMKHMTQECTCGWSDFWRIRADGRKGLSEIQSWMTAATSGTTYDKTISTLRWEGEWQPYSAQNSKLHKRGWRDKIHRDPDETYTSRWRLTYISVIHKTLVQLQTTK